MPRGAMVVRERSQEAPRMGARIRECRFEFAPCGALVGEHSHCVPAFIGAALALLLPGRVGVPRHHKHVIQSLWLSNAPDCARVDGHSPRFPSPLSKLRLWYDI